MKSNRQQGNVLFLILIAVALFAALSYAVTKSSRGSGDADEEGLLISTAEYTQLIAELRVTIQRMVISGTDVMDIKLCTGFPLCYPDGGFGSYCSTGVNCVFAPEGGNFDPSRFSGRDNIVVILFESASNPVISGHIGTEQVIIQYRGNNGALGSINESLCQKLNKEYGISDSIPEELTGTDVLGDGLPLIEGKWDFCMDIDNTATVEYTATHLLAVK